MLKFYVTPSAGSGTKVGARARSRPTTDRLRNTSPLKGKLATTGRDNKVNLKKKSVLPQG